MLCLKTLWRQMVGHKQLSKGGPLNKGPLWALTNVSVEGNGLKAKKHGCQDAQGLILFPGTGIGIATVADGAGSAQYSKWGSRQAIKISNEVFVDLIKTHGWNERGVLPSPGQWKTLSVAALKSIRAKLIDFIEENQLEVRDFHSTLIVVLFFPRGLLLTHIGDGRACYRDEDGGWKSFMEPIRGNRANETVFLTSGFWESNPDRFVESNVVYGNKSGFALMSDGCEMAFFNINNQRGTADANEPNTKFFEPARKALIKMAADGKSREEINEIWRRHLQEGTPKLKMEADDKTLIMGVRIEKEDDK